MGIPSSSGSEPGSALLACDFPVNGLSSSEPPFLFTLNFSSPEAEEMRSGISAITVNWIGILEDLT